MRAFIHAVIGSFLAGACGGGGGLALTKDATTSSLRDERCKRSDDGRASLALKSASERAELEAAMKDGLVVVSRGECGDITILPQCRVQASYRYESHPKKSNVEELHDRRSRDPLMVASVTTGAYRADTATLSAPQLMGRCEGATHVVTAASVGAFLVRRDGDRLAASGGASASASSDHDVARDGDPEKCKDEASGPTDGCNALVDVELTPIKNGPNDKAGTPAGAHTGIQTGIIAPQ